MTSIEPSAIVITVTLVLLTCLTTAQEWHHIKHPLPVSDPTSLPVHAPPSDGVSIGNLEQSLSSHQMKVVASNNYGTRSGASGEPGQSWGYGGLSGQVMPGTWSGGIGGSTGSMGGLQFSAAGGSSSINGLVMISAVVLVTGFV